MKNNEKKNVENVYPPLLEIEELEAAQGSTEDLLLLNVGLRLGSFDREMGSKSTTTGFNRVQVWIRAKNCTIKPLSKFTNLNDQVKVKQKKSVSKGKSVGKGFGATIGTQLSISANHSEQVTDGDSVEVTSELPPFSVIAESGNKWTIRTNTVDYLLGLVLGHNNLCELELDENFSVLIQVTATSGDLEVRHVDTNQLLSDDKKSIIKILESKRMRHDKVTGQMILADGFIRK